VKFGQNTWVVELLLLLLLLLVVNLGNWRSYGPALHKDDI
jgi:hypothetical protein